MFVEPARGHIDTRCSDTAKSRNVLRLRHLRSADKHLLELDIYIAVTFCMISDRLQICNVSIFV
jgi:hypothetical protein